MKRSRFYGTGGYVPPKVVTNEDLSKLMDTSDEWITQRTGIKTRHFAEHPTTTADLALEASKIALDDAGWTAEELDLIIVATTSPEHTLPGTSAFLQAKLGVKGCAILDIRNQCTGFIYAVSIADQFIQTGMYERILVVGCEIQSNAMDFTDRGRDMARRGMHGCFRR
jgi:3-oxoacyl-[acyl-carrier-protein] synthase-3